MARVVPLQVRLVRELSTKRIFAMKSMIKEAMIMKNQVEHVHAERDVLATSSNPRVVTLHYSFQVGDAPLVVVAATCTRHRWLPRHVPVPSLLV